MELLPKQFAGVRDLCLLHAFSPPKYKTLPLPICIPLNCTHVFNGVKVTAGYRRQCRLKLIMKFISYSTAEVNYMYIWSVRCMDVQCCNCCRHSLLQTFDVAIRSSVLPPLACRVQTLFTARTKQPLSH